jgi:predicted nucleic-acid-binding protein
MIGLDTNVLIRIFVEDNIGQCKAARALVAGCRPGELFVSALVLAELVRVLRRRLAKSVDEVVDIVDRILEAPEFTIGDQALLEDALGIYRTGRSEFSDCLIAVTALRAGADRLLTFDREAALHVPGTRHLDH